jgi:hypothetical protein
MQYVLNSLASISSNSTDAGYCISLSWYNLMTCHFYTHSCSRPSACQDCSKVFSRFTSFVEHICSRKSPNEDLCNLVLALMVHNTISFDQLEALTATITNPGMWSALMALVKKSSSELRLKILQVLILILNQNSSNIKDLICQESWITWFCKLYDREPKDQRQNKLLIVELLVNISFETYIRLSKEFNQVTTKSFDKIILFFKSYPKKSYRLIRFILHSLVNKLANSKKLFPVSFEDPIWKNLLHLCALIQRFIFGCAFIGERPIKFAKDSSEPELELKSASWFSEENKEYSYGIHVSLEKSCGDFDLLKKFVELLKGFQFSDYLAQPNLTALEKEYIMLILKKTDFFSEACNFLTSLQNDLNQQSNVDDYLVDVEAMVKKFLNTKTLRSRKSFLTTLNRKDSLSPSPSHSLSAASSDKKTRKITNLLSVFANEKDSNEKPDSFEPKQIAKYLYAELVKKNKNVNKEFLSEIIASGSDIASIFLRNGYVSDINQAILLGNLLLGAELLIPDSSHHQQNIPPFDSISSHMFQNDSSLYILILNP